MTTSNFKKTARALLSALLLLGLLSCGSPARTGAQTEAEACILPPATTTADVDIPRPGGFHLIESIKRTEDNLLFNFGNLYHPFVLKEQLPGNEGYPYTMWFFGWARFDGNPGYPGCDAIFVARGKDPYAWEVYAGNGVWDDTMTPKLWAPIVTASDAWCDNWHNGDASVVRKDGLFYMAYSSLSSGPDMKFSWEYGDTDGDTYCVMGAMSEDGINWTKSGGPILIWEHEADWVFDDDPDNFLGLYCRPSLMYDEGKWKLWFDYWMPGAAMGYAEADGDADIMDAASWTVVRAGKDPVIYNFPNPDVIKIGDRYYAFGDPIVLGHGADPELASDEPWKNRQIAAAVSDDGVSFTMVGWIQHDSDSPASHTANAYYEDGTLYLFYATQIGGIPYNYRYNRIRVIEISERVFSKW